MKKHSKCNFPSAFCATNKKIFSAIYIYILITLSHYNITLSLSPLSPAVPNLLRFSRCYIHLQKPSLLPPFHNKYHHNFYNAKIPQHPSKPCAL